MNAESLGSLRRTHTCGELRRADAGRDAILMGWVQRTRDHGGVLFLDLRDRYGMTQVVVHPESAPSEVVEKARALRAEFVVAALGKVSARPADMVNRNMPTGEIELLATGIHVLNVSQTPPFEVEDETQASEDLRLEYRYIDLRRPALQSVIELRHRLMFETRRFLSAERFLEIETPMLVKPTPEGARDYVVPARLHPGKFYALPQSPQLYKQMLMVCGFDRYFQIARCLRDEDARADRQAEFAQIDVEMSFVGEEDVFDVVERLVASLVREARGIDVPVPFPRMRYEEAMQRFGSDKPDLRFGLEIRDVTGLAAETAFGIFRDAVGAGGVVQCLVVPGGAAWSRPQVDALEETAKRFGAKGLARAKLTERGFETGAGKFLEPMREAFVGATGAGAGDLLLFVADRRLTALRALGAVRVAVGESVIHPDKFDYRFLWVHEFPLFERDEEQGRWAPAHHMFTMPLESDLPYLESDPGRVHARLYDLVLSGVELGSGSVRIHRRDIQERVMRVVGMSAEEAEGRFGFLLKAFQYGAPPHGGIALGFDRFVMLMAGGDSIRDTIAFPKTARAASLMDGCPSEVPEGDLRELHIRTVG
jgi:aspartyl-tRNA synthetase